MEVRAVLTISSSSCMVWAIAFFCFSAILAAWGCDGEMALTARPKLLQYYVCIYLAQGQKVATLVLRSCLVNRLTC